MSKPLTITIEIADSDTILAAIVTRATEVLVARLGPEATRRTEEAVDKAVAVTLDAQVAAAVDAVLADGFAVRDEWGRDTGERISLSEMIRRYLGAQMDGRQTRLERVIRRAVEDAISGDLVDTVREANERARVLLDGEIAQRLAKAMRDVGGV